MNSIKVKLQTCSIHTASHAMPSATMLGQPSTILAAEGLLPKEAKMAMRRHENDYTFT